MAKVKWFIANLFFRKELITMVELYVTLIIKGLKKFSQVPKSLQPRVRQMLIDLDLEELIDE